MDQSTILGYPPEQCNPAGCMTELLIQLAVIMVGKQFVNNAMEILFPILLNWSLLPASMPFLEVEAGAWQVAVAGGEGSGEVPGEQPLHALGEGLHPHARPRDVPLRRVPRNGYRHIIPIISSSEQG